MGEVEGIGWERLFRVRLEYHRGHMISVGLVFVLGAFPKT